MATDKPIEYFNNQTGSEEVYTNEFLEQQNELPILYKKLVNKRFNVQKWLEQFSDFAKKHKRIRYAILTSLIIGEKKDSNITNLNINLEAINSVIRKSDSTSPDTVIVEDKVFDMYFKFFDHCSLALTQRTIFHQSDEMTIQRTKKIVEQNMEKTIEEKVSEYDKNITNQLIGLVSIFTALSFVIFGGINILQNLLDYAKNTILQKLLVVADIWLLCMGNIFLLFIKLIAMLTERKKLKLWLVTIIMNIVLVGILWLMIKKFHIYFYPVFC